MSFVHVKRNFYHLCTLIEVYTMNDAGNNYDINSGNGRKISNFLIVK